MNILLNLILSFYPAVFIWKAIPSGYIVKLNTFAPQGLMHFIAHLVAFGIIFIIVYCAIRKTLGRPYASQSRSGILALALSIFFAVCLGLITFYTVLPGETLYHAPALVSKYLLSAPYNFIILILPFVYLFFD